MMIEKMSKTQTLVDRSENQNLPSGRVSALMGSWAACRLIDGQVLGQSPHLPGDD